MNYDWQLLSDAAKAKLGELAMADKESIVAEKMFNGLVEGRVSKQLKEILSLRHMLRQRMESSQLQNILSQFLRTYNHRDGSFRGR